MNKYIYLNISTYIENQNSFFVFIASLLLIFLDPRIFNGTLRGLNTLVRAYKLLENSKMCLFFKFDARVF